MLIKIISIKKIKIFLDKIKFLWQKENRREILYVFSTILIIGAVIILFIWTAMFVVRAINTAFIPPANFDTDVLSIDFDGLVRIAPRLGIDIRAINNQSDAGLEEKSVLIESTAKIAEDIDIASIKLEILNGTITPGLAASWKEKFTGAGFLADNIKTGNADKRDYSGIVVYYNSTEAIFGKVSAVLNQSNLAIKTEKDEKLDNFSFKIIIGE